MLMFSLAVSAQGSVLVLDNKVEKVNEDVLTGLNIDRIGRDRSNRPCARIKLHVTRMSPSEIKQLQVCPIGGNLVIMKSLPAAEGNGLIVEMTALNSARFYLHHPKYGDSNPVSLSLEGDTEYRMEAWCNFLQTIVVSCPRAGASVSVDGVFMGRISPENNALSIGDVMLGEHLLEVSYGEDKVEKKIEVNEDRIYFTVDLASTAHLQQYVVFELKPAEAMVTLDGDLLPGDASGNASRLVKYGVHEYLVEAKGYHSARGEFTLNAGNANRTLHVPVALKPAFGYLSVGGTTVEGARIYVDKEFKGTAPKDSIRLDSGMHRLDLVRPLYRDCSQSFVVHDGIISHLSPVMSADYSHLTFEVADGAAIYVNDEFKGRGSWTGDLASGTYEVKTVLENHRPATRTLIVVPGMPSDPIVLQKPTPVLGILSVESVPVGADIFIDGVFKGKTPSYLTDVLVGRRKVEVRKEGWGGHEQTVTVEEGERTEMKAVLDRMKTVAFTCAQYGASLYVDGTYLGSADGKYELSIGRHVVEVKLEGFRPYREEIEVSGETELVVSVSLSDLTDAGTTVRKEVEPNETDRKSGQLDIMDLIFGTGKKDKKNKPEGTIQLPARKKAPLGFNLGLGVESEAEYSFEAYSIGAKLSGSIGNFRNRFNVEAALKMMYLMDIPGYTDGSGLHDGNSDSSSGLMQWRISIEPRYNILRKTSASDLYLYAGAGLSYNFLGKTYEFTNPSNLSTILRVGTGFSFYDISFYWQYDMTPVYNENMASGNYSRSHMGVSIAFYLF